MLNLPFSLHLLTRLLGWLPNAPGGLVRPQEVLHVITGKVSQQSLHLYIADPLLLQRGRQTYF